MISSITSQTSYNKQTLKKKYEDPLEKIGFLSYSNELGTAISEIAPKLGAALWAPTFMYIGADIYDKYKNDKNDYNPSGTRAFERALFQGLHTLIALPAIIFAGQSIVSPLGKMDKTGISGNTKDAIYRHTKNVIDQAPESAFENFETFNNLIKTSLENRFDARAEEIQKTDNILKKFFKKNFKNKFAILEAEKSKVLTYAEQNAKKVFDIMSALKNNDKSKVPSQIYRAYKKHIPIMNELYKDGDYSYQASRRALKEYQNSLIFKNKLLKTLGGFGAIFLLANPAGNIMDKYLMKKYINPEIDKISSEAIKEFKMKTIYAEMNKNRQIILEDKNVKTLNRFEESMTLHGLKSKAAEYQ